MIGAAAFAGALALLALLTLILSRNVERRYPRMGLRARAGSGFLHVVETRPNGAPRGVVALVHGGSGNYADPHLALSGRLAALGFRVFAFDRPGHGYSQRIQGRAASAPERQAALIREALEGLGVTEAILVVHSLAGVLGLAMALETPRLVRGLVALSPVSHPWKGGVSWYYHAGAAPFVGALFRWLVTPYAILLMLPGAVRAVFAPNPTPEHYIERTRLKLLIRPWHFRANCEDFVDIHAATQRLSPRYGEIAVPVAVVMGARDTLVSAEIHARGIARDVRGATLTMLDGVGHSPHFAAPEAVIAAILDVAARADSKRKTTAAV